MQTTYHEFDNEIKVYKHHLLDLQIERYKNVNLHEPEEEKWFLENLSPYQDKPNPILLDIGAAIGYYSILAKKRIPNLQIHAFEPFVSHVQYMRDNILLNDLSLNDFAIHEMAISNTVGKSQFHLDTFSSVLLNTTPQPFWKRLFNSQKSETITTVNTTTLDVFCSQFDTQISLIKVDVQGFEIQVLEGANQLMHDKRIDRWIIGTHSLQLHQNCISRLQSAGYRIHFEEQVVSNQPDGIIIAHLQ